jgi:hypothetical protein
MGDVAGGFEPRPQSELAAQQQQRFLGKLDNLQHGPARQAMRLRQRGRHIDRVEQAGP